MLFILHVLFLLRLGSAAGQELWYSPPAEPRALTISAASLPDSMVSAAWYAGWHATDQPLSAVSWSKYNIINYAFGLTTEDPSVISLQDSDLALLPQFVATAHKHNVKASLSIGGWTGSRWFSSNVGSLRNRTAFVKAVTRLVKDFELDGVDFDWEYPGIQGIGCNTVNSNDTVNFLSFLRELRQSVGSNVILSAATDLKPFPNTPDTPFAGMSPFGEVLDYIVIMNYDIPSAPSGAGSNSPLNDDCAPSENQHGSAQSAVTAWTNAGMPRDHIVLGVPMYGHSYRVPQSLAYADPSHSLPASFPEYDITNKPKGDRWNGDGGMNVCGVYEPPGGTYAFWSLVSDGFLDSNGSPRQGIAYRLDGCSQTPYVYNESSEILIAYDDTQSFAAKGNFIRTNGLRGFAVWESAGDYNDLLVNAILNTTIASSTVNTSSSTSSTDSTKSSTASQLVTPRVKVWLLTIGIHLMGGWVLRFQ